MSSYSKDNSAKGCSKQECLESLQLILDGEACKDTEEKFIRHLSDCLPCYNLYHLDKAVKELIQTKIQKKPVPSFLLNNIRNKIFVINQTA
jgi:anti-sigma factor (TIGR02949 family)